MTTLANGFAAAVQPVAASTQITTDTQGITAGEVTIPAKDGDMPAYRAMSANGKNLPTAFDGCAFGQQPRFMARCGGSGQVR